MALGQNSLNSKQLGHPFFVKVREGGGGGGKTAPVLDGEDEGHTLSEAGKDLRESFHSCFSLSFASFFFFFLILAKEFTHQVLANSGNKELVKRDSGGYSKRAAGAPPPHPCHFGFHPGEAWAGLQEAREKRRVQRLPPRGSVP